MKRRFWAKSKRIRGEFYSNPRRSNLIQILETAGPRHPSDLCAGGHGYRGGKVSPRRTECAYMATKISP
jgi:hypothetical protein